MKNTNLSPRARQLDTAGHNADICQDSNKTVAKTKDTLRVRSGMGTANYWKSRLYRNTYTDRSGAKIEIPEFYVRMRYDGITRQVRLDYSNRDTAADQALALYQRLQDEGWAAIDRRKLRVPASLSVDDFVKAFEHAAKRMARAPRPITVSAYAKNLKLLCRYGRITELNQLTPEAIERARDNYRETARKAGRQESAITNTLSTITRNSAACFSRKAREQLRKDGHTVGNPFEGIECKTDIPKVVKLPDDIVNRIWKDAPLLRDGDPGAGEIRLANYRAKYRKTHDNREPGRWVPIDWRKPHRDAYAVLLLALGCGLRANECDKARWSWFSMKDGEWHLEIKAEVDFIPKGGGGREIKIPAQLYEAILATRNDTGPYVIGGPASTDSSKKGGGLYRRPNTFRVVNEWLRKRGIEAGNKHGKPLHSLRKQFGSEIATRFGLFHAQKLLGHASPDITTRHYAAQTELPSLTHIPMLG